MPLWTENPAQPPKFLGNTALYEPSPESVGFPGMITAGQTPIANCYADQHGWILQWAASKTNNIPNFANAKTECLVAIPNLCNLIGNGATTIASFWPITFDCNVPVILTVSWNKQIILNAATANVNVVSNGSVATTNTLATYLAGNNTNQLVFQFTSQVDLKQNTGYSGNNTVLITYSVPSYTTLNVPATALLDLSNSSLYSSPNINCLAWPTPQVNNQPQALLIHQIPSVINMAFQYASINVGANTNNLYVNFSSNAYVYGGNSKLSLSSANGPVQNIQAYYVAGNGTTQLVYEVLAPANSTWLSVNVSSTGPSWTGPIIDFANGAVNLTVSSALSATAANLNVYSAIVMTQFIFANLFMTTNQTSNVFMILNAPVQVLGGGGVNTANLLIGSTNGSYNIVATFTGQGNGTSNLAFQFTTPANTTNLNVTTGAASVGLNTGTIFLSNYPGYFVNVGSYTITAAMSTQVANT